MKFIFSENNSLEVIKLLNTKSDLKCAVAFLGAEAEKILPHNNKNIKIICNLESGATNPYLIEKLKNRNIPLKTNKRLHSKVYLASDICAIVGSSNLSANGLSFEGEELNGWVEASIKLEDKKTLEEIDAWFCSQWENAIDITDDLIEKAKIAWKDKRNTRKNNSHDDSSILNQLQKNPLQFKDKRIFISIYRINGPSNEAEEKFNIVKEQLNINERLTYWEDWSELPEDSYFISLYFGPKKGFKFESYYYVPTPKKDYIEKIQYPDGKSSEILICFLQDSIKGMTLSPKDKLKLQENVEKLWEIDKHSSKDEATFISLYEARNILFPEVKT